MAASTDFSKATSVDVLDAHTYRVNLDEAFCIGSVPNGGYAASCMLAAGKIHLSSRHQPDAFTAHFEYPDRATKGPAIVIIEDVKLGRQRSTLHLTLWQDGLLNQAPWITPNVSRRVALAYTNHINLQTYTGFSIPTAYGGTPSAELPQLPDFDALLSQGADEAWEEQQSPLSSAIVRSLRNWRFYLPRSEHFTPGVVDIWMCLANGEPITQAALPYVIDSFPYNLHVYLAAPELREFLQPPAQPKQTDRRKSKESRDDELRAGLWFPTVVMNMEVKTALPEEGVRWLTMRVITKQIQEGRFDIDLMVRTVDGEVKALSHHVAMIVSIEKNTVKKGSVPKAAL